MDVSTAINTVEQSLVPAGRFESRARDGALHLRAFIERLIEAFIEH